MEQQHEAGGQGARHRVHGHVGDHVDEGDQQGQVHRGASDQRDLGAIIIIIIIVIVIVSVVITLVSSSGAVASWGEWCMRTMPDHTDNIDTIVMSYIDH